MERLQKVIAHAGIASRRKAEELIQNGAVKVNGKVIRELGVKVTDTDRIEVNGVQIETEEKVYFLMYKPAGVLSAATDDKGRKTVVDLLPEIKERIYPVGRLDYQTTGLLLLTNDGEFANKLMHPKFEIPKTYIARVKGIPTRESLRMLEKGIKLEDGKTAPAKLKFLSGEKDKDKAIIQITIHEGRNRQVRRMFEAIGHPVQKLKREQFGFLTLGFLKAGETRELSPHEVKQLHAMAEGGAKRNLN
ncbi:pseudouridine synthase [Mangrovibacillus cuniculi]|uniref:Pseudouridine synthase n=1 Tax=Mangrovibacillus cuniculi TaxID=2593652 RepID=A0A7S8CB48_9BACI|nr:pseudouridine synthase [Mangrovibacillus cuniculi]QPC46739.1 rRNA pseudouridine synthase [Mangrovibacillus cuniculi]